MRDANRLYDFYAELQRIHIQMFLFYSVQGKAIIAESNTFLPFRFFLTVFFGITDFGIADPFYWEEDECLEKLRKFAGETNDRTRTID